MPQTYRIPHATVHNYRIIAKLYITGESNRVTNKSYDSGTAQKNFHTRRNWQQDKIQ